MENYQRILLPYAYNILGSVEDAKDAIQDVLSNFLASGREDIENVKGYLIKSVINQSVNMKNKRKRLSFEDNRLPEPFATEEADTDINLKDIVSYSLLILLEQLNPRERAVFILKEAFGYTHEEIAEVLSSNVEHSRKLLSRAKAKLNPARKSVKPWSQRNIHESMLEKYVHAIRSRDTSALENLLSRDIAYFADGGEKIKVIRKTCTGLHDVADLVIFSYHKFNAASSVVHTEINHQPALLYYQGTTLQACQVFDIPPGKSKIARIFTVVDPEKLRNL